MENNKNDNREKNEELIEPESSKKKGKYSKGFYAAFALCLCAVAAAAWYTYGDVTNYTKPQTELPTVAATEKNDEQAEVKIEGVTQPATETETQLQTEKNQEESTDAQQVVGQTATEEAEPDKIMYPAGEKVLKEWSGDSPVYFETLKDWRTHKAADYEANEGDNVKSMDSGMVTEIKVDDLYGPTVVIEHNSGFIAFYSGVEVSESLSVGDHVSAGDVIGKVTKIPCESKEKSHIHLEIKKNGSYINPVDLFYQ